MAFSPSLLKRTVLTFFVLILFYRVTLYAQSCPTQGTEIFPELSGQELIDTLVAEYKSTTVLSYDGAREQLYGSIDNRDGIVEGIYTGYRAAIDPNGENPRLQALDVGINAEHSWPQSKGAVEGTNAHSDMHHLYPAYESANSSRSNHPYYEIPDQQTDGWWRYQTQFSTPVADSIDHYSEKRNSHPNSGYSGSWEPRESVEGDIARSMFYFYTMYKTQADEADPFFFEIQKEFLRSWNGIDQVSQQEYERTCAIAEFQDQKVNPFVIDPTLVDRAYFEGQVGETNVQFAASVLTVGEGQGDLEIQVSISNPDPDLDTSVDVVASGGSATADEDYQAFAPKTVTFPAGSLERQYFTITILDDDIQEPEESIVLTLQNIQGPESAGIGSPETLTITLQDDDGDRPTDVWVNEFHYENVGNDQDEFVEIGVDAEFADLTDVTLTLYNGNGGTVYNSFSGNDFTKGSTIQGISFYYVELPQNGIQNGDPDGMSLDISGEIVQFLSYEGTFTAVEGPAQNLNSTDIGVQQSNDNTPIGSSLSLMGTGRAYSDFSWEAVTSHTMGEVNTNQSIDVASSNEENPDIADRFILEQNYPNPFNPSTVISYQLAENSEVKLEVFDMLGRKVAVLVNSDLQRAGNYSITFNGTGLSSGIYMYQLQTKTQSYSRKMVLTK